MLVNSEAASFYQSQTDNFIRQREPYRYVCNDYISSTVSNGLVRLQFQPANQRPVIVIINAVTNSSSHKPYELLVNEGHYRQTQYSADIVRWRRIIDSVEPSPPPPPALSSPELSSDDKTFEFTLTGQAGKAYRVEASTNFMDWSVIASSVANGAVLRDTNAPGYQQRFYRAIED